MSGIIGFFNTKGISESFKKAVSYWNKDYGTRNIEKQISPNVWMAVNLEHMSDSVPEQSGFLNINNQYAVIDALIYNRSEIIKKYTLSATASDEEILFQLILKFGPDILKDVNGDFTGVIYDSESNSFTMFRDHMGIRPLYYYIDDDCFLFSTDMRGLLAVPGLKIDINEYILFKQLSGKSGCNRTYTDYQQIHYAQKAAWYTIQITPKKLKISEPSEYWQLGAKKIRLKSDQEYAKKMRELIEDAVKLRVNAFDGRIGSEFSGGLDSSVLTILLARMKPDSCFFSWSDDPKEWPLRKGKDERKIILDICNRENIECKFKKQNHWIIHDTTTNITKRLYPPYANTFPISIACEYFQSQGVKAVLTGHGGDQGVSHRCYQYELWYHHEYLSFFKASWNAMKGRKHRLYGTAKDIINRLIINHPEKTMKYQWGYDNIQHLMNPEFLSRMLDSYVPELSAFGFDIVEYFKRGATRERMDNTAFQGAPYGVRYLFPYLDYRVIDFAVSIPRHLYNNGERNRLVYMNAFKDIIPESLVKMHDKSNTSYEGSHIFSKEDIVRENNETKELLDMMDYDFWKEYLDLNHPEKFYLPDNASEEDWDRHSYQRAHLLYCNVLRYDMLHAGDAVLEEDKNV